MGQIIIDTKSGAEMRG